MSWRRAYVAAALALGCGGGGSGGVDAAGASDPPEVRSVFVTVELGGSALIDLNDSDQTRVLPVPAQATFRVQGADDETAADALVVDVVDADGHALPGQSATFRNGLWDVALEVEPGVALRARVTDGDGQQTASAHQLTLPSHTDALVGAWTTRLFDTDQSVLERWDATFTADQEWSEERPAGTVAYGGLYMVEADGRLRLSERLGPTDSDPDTVEREQVSELYIDDTYFAANPWTRESGSGGVGTFTRAHELLVPPSGWQSFSETLVTDDTPVQDPVEPTLVWDGSFTLTIERSEGANMTTTVRRGRYRSIPADDYNLALGNFLHRETTMIDDNPIDPPLVEFDIQVLRLEYMLIAPRVRQ